MKTELVSYVNSETKMQSDIGLGFNSELKTFLYSYINFETSSYVNYETKVQNGIGFNNLNLN